MPKRLNRMKTKLSKNDLPFAIFIIFSLVLVVVVALAIHCRRTDWINNTILGLTAFIVLWYTREMAKQNRLQTRPILTLMLVNGLPPSLKNEGKGPALNSLVTKWSVQSTLTQATSRADEKYKIPIPPYISPDSTPEFKMYKHDESTGINGTVSEPDVLNQIGNVVTMTVRYEDIEGSVYTSQFRVRSGRLEWVSFGGSKLQMNETASRMDAADRQ